MLRSKLISLPKLKSKSVKLAFTKKQDILLSLGMLILVPFLLVLFYPEPYLISILTLALIYFIVVLGYNMVLTGSGLFHLGFSVHFAIGAYLSGIIMVRYGWETIPTALLVLVGSVIVTVLIAIPSLRFIGDYLSIVTLAFAEIVRQVLLNWKEVTNGSNGIFGIPRPIFLGYTSTSPIYLFIVIVIMAILAFLLYNAIVSSRIGLAWEAIKQNEDAARSMGIRSNIFKFLCLILGSLFAGIGGLGYAHFASITDPSMSSFDVTLILITIVVLGGGSSTGILLGSIVMTAIPQIFLGLNLYRQLAVGIFIVFLANWRPEGLSLLIRQSFAPYKKSSKPIIQPSIIDEPRYSDAKDNMYAVKVDKAVKSFGGLVAVNELSVNIRYGSIFGIIGPNGAGKTTLFNIISGVYQADDGGVQILGREVTKWPEWRVARLGVGRTFQNIKLFKKLTVMDNVLFAAAIPTYSRIYDRACWKKAIEIASASLEFVGLADQAQNLASSLPYGGQRRLEIARALALQPTLLLLDEPSAGMNPKEREELAELVQDIRRQGITVICIEHNMPFLLPIADEILVMAEGKCLAQGKPSIVTSNDSVIDAYLGRRSVHVASNKP